MCSSRVEKVMESTSKASSNKIMRKLWRIMPAMTNMLDASHSILE
jgi:hypothetical protein